MQAQTQVQGFGKGRYAPPAFSTFPAPAVAPKQIVCPADTRYQTTFQAGGLSTKRLHPSKGKPDAQRIRYFSVFYEQKLLCLNSLKPLILCLKMMIALLTY